MEDSSRFINQVSPYKSLKNRKHLRDEALAENTGDTADLANANTSDQSDTHIIIEPYDARRLATVCGNCNHHLSLLEDRFSITIKNRGNLFQFIGEPNSVAMAQTILQKCYELTTEHKNLSTDQIHLAIREAKMAKKSLEPCNDPTKNTTRTPPQAAKQPRPTHSTTDPSSESQLTTADTFIIKAGNIQVKPRGDNQLAFVKNIHKLDLNFGIGPAGTGKTYLAVANAIASLDRGDVRKIILVRPAVEAGEKLGFLPGDMAEKVNPYLRPLYDALYEMLGAERVAKYQERQVIEIVPLAYMRGRTLNHAFIILDEAQNTTVQQMKMFLTRLGFGSKAVITGDHTQVDLPRGIESGLKNAMKILSNIDNIGFTTFSSSDVVRHSLVQTIIEAYDQYNENGS